MKPKPNIFLTQTKVLIKKMKIEGVKVISYSYYEKMLIQLVNRIKSKNISCKYIYGIPRGGLPIAVHLSHFLNIPLVLSLKKSHCLIVDDISDTGKTFLQLYNRDITNVFVSLFIRENTKFIPDIYIESVITQWVQFPWEKDNPKI